MNAWQSVNKFIQKNINLTGENKQFFDQRILADFLNFIVKK